MIPQSRQLRTRSRIITLSTAGSFFSNDCLRAASRFKLTETFDYDLESQEQHGDSFQKTLELYFKVDQKTAKVNEMCIELLKKEIALNQLKTCVNDKSLEIQVDDAEKSIQLLKKDQELDALETEINELLFLVENKENENLKDCKNIEAYQEELKKSKKEFEEKKKIAGIYQKLQNFESKLKEEFFNVKGQKAKVLEKFLLINNQFSSLSLKVQEISAKSQDLKNQAPDQKILQNTKSSISALVSEIDSKTLKNQSLTSEITELDRTLKEKLHSFKIRKDWLQDSLKTLESKSAMTRFISKQLESQKSSQSHKLSIVQSCLEDLDQMEARLEAQEMKQISNEASFKDELSSLVKTVKKKMNQKSVSFC